MVLRIERTGVEVSQSAVSDNLIETRLQGVLGFLTHARPVYVTVVEGDSSKPNRIKVCFDYEMMKVRQEAKNESLSAALSSVCTKIRKTMALYNTRKEALSAGYGTVVREKHITTDVMAREDAATALVLSGYDFYAFRDKETEKNAIIYKRATGGYGVLIVD